MDNYGSDSGDPTPSGANPKSVQGTERKRLMQRLVQLRADRQTWVDHWRDLSDYILPRRSRFLVNDYVTAGAKKNGNIINGKPTVAARTLAAGMMAGVTSPSRPWFRLGTPDPGLNRSPAVKSWLQAVERILRDSFAKSNIYGALHLVYTDLGPFGTSAMYVEEDAEDLLRAYTFPIGQYFLANSDRLFVDTVYREFPMSVAQMVQKFGIKACSDRVQSAYKEQRYDLRVNVLHATEPNRNRKHGANGYRGMKYQSCWSELDGTDSDGLLREAGFEEFPYMCTRWMTTAEDVYGSSPGMDALGDIKGLQLLEKTKLQVVEKLSNPPMKGPASLMGQRTSLLPGDMTYVAELPGSGTFEPAITVHPQALAAIREAIQDHVHRIDDIMYASLWLMIANGESDPNKTATEIVSLEKEKMLQLGPTMERLEDELLDPLIDRSFAVLNRLGYIPPPPEELAGQELRVEYTSIMAQAQKMLATTAIERTSAFVGNLVAVFPEARDKLNTDKMIDEYGDSVGINPDLIRSGEEVAQIRADRAKQQQAAAQAQQAATLVAGAKTLSETDMQGDNALNRMLGTTGQTIN